MWTIIDIEEIESEEEVLLGNLEMMLITIQDDFNQIRQIEVTRQWLEFQEFEIDDEWPEDMLEELDNDTLSEQSQWTQMYMENLEEDE